MKGSRLTRSVSAHLVERFIFNFRLPPDTLENHLPVKWLRPQVVNGWSVVSFCILKLERLMLWPLPSVLGFDTISCAYRCGAIDTLANPGPSVYIIGRNTDSPIITRMGPVLFLNAMSVIRADISHMPHLVNIHARHLNGQHLFSAKVRPSKRPEQLDSQVFNSLDGFVNFIKDGVSSYAPSIYDNYYSRVDLYKQDTDYESVDATVEYSWLDYAWQDAGLVFDSAVRARGGRYKWTYRGLAPAQLQGGSPSMPAGFLANSCVCKHR